eukprot:COSAG03_NODE_11568_length_586_cov_1.010267_2_plen_49_part_01
MLRTAARVYMPVIRWKLENNEEARARARERERERERETVCVHLYYSRTF